MGTVYETMYLDDPDRNAFPAPGSSVELEEFARLQTHLGQHLREIDPTSRDLPRSVVVVPSLSLDQHVLKKIPGAPFYEERLLCLLMMLRMPRTDVIYVTSEPVHPTIIDYYLHLLPGIPVSHARKRLTLICCHDNSPNTLTAKILARPRLLHRIREKIEHPNSAYMTCFATTALERTLAVRLGIPLYGCDPDLVHLGDKSHGREVMREAGIPIPDGIEHLRDHNDMAEALSEVKRRNPDLIRSVVKLNEGFSGEGNSLFYYNGCPKGDGLKHWISDELPTRLKFEAKDEVWDTYQERFSEMGGIVECFLEGEQKQSPSARCHIDPLGKVTTMSVQDQILGGPSGQVYLACAFPAVADYRLEIQNMGVGLSELLRDRGVLGQVGVDFISIKQGDAWKTYGVEVNIRKGGTTHPFFMLQFLTDGRYDPETGTYRTPADEPRCYYATDNLEKDIYRGLTPDDLIDIAVENDIHFHGATQQGVVFHLIGALSEFGKLGVVCIADTPEQALKSYEETTEILDREAFRGSGAKYDTLND
jgi:hypothetical protein